MCVVVGGHLSSCRAGGRNGERLDNNWGEGEKGKAIGKREGGKRTGAKYRALHPASHARMHSADTAMGTGLSPCHPCQETMAKSES